jgi:acetylornithine deacetylase
MKSGAASDITAARAVGTAGIRLKGDILVNIVIDKEVSGHETFDTAIRAWRPDAGISGETSDLAIQLAWIGRI